MNDTELFAPVLAAIEAEGLHLVFPRELEPAHARLMDTLGVTWSVDENARRLADPLPPAAYRTSTKMGPLKHDLGIA